MMEINTCEQYVLAKLKELEETNECLRSTLEAQDETLQYLQSILTEIAKDACVCTTKEGKRFISNNGIWEYDAPTAFKYVLDNFSEQLRFDSHEY